MEKPLTRLLSSLVNERKWEKDGERKNEKKNEIFPTKTETVTQMNYLSGTAAYAQTSYE